MQLKPKKKGFASMDPAKLREVSSLGGKVAQANGRCHRFAVGSEESRAAGRKGGLRALENRVLRDVESRCPDPFAGPYAPNTTD